MLFSGRRSPSTPSSYHSTDMTIYVPTPIKLKRVSMLYIDCELNGENVRAFVDSGAQMTLISSACAERCNISQLIDNRFQGVARGVGTQKIVGRIHLLPLKIQGDYFPCTISVLDKQPMDLLLGLDMLRRHRCIIDLNNNVLRIGTTATQAPFLPEKKITRLTPIDMVEKEAQLSLEDDKKKKRKQKRKSLHDNAKGVVIQYVGKASSTENQPKVKETPATSQRSQNTEYSGSRYDNYTYNTRDVKVPHEGTHVQNENYYVSRNTVNNPPQTKRDDYPSKWDESTHAGYGNFEY